MADKGMLLSTVALQGLETAPSQVCGAVRLVPLLRHDARGDLRLSRRVYQDDLTLVALKGTLEDPSLIYGSYVPHGLVLSWGEGGADVVRGTHLAARDGKQFDLGIVKLRLMHRMAKREAPNQLRMLPLHLAMEGFLSLFFSGPDIAWAEYSRRALRDGLSPRMEMAYGGHAIPGFADALRTFEIHERQCGLLVFVADALASAFVTPRHEDYRALHPTLLADFYSDLIVQYGLLYDTVSPVDVSIDAAKVSDLADLRAELSRVRKGWSEFQGFMAGDLIGRPVESRRIYQAGAFTLQRFITDLDPARENHIGEAIVRNDGTLEYLKTYRLSAAQTRRAYLLSQLAAAGWVLEAAAEQLQTSVHELVNRLEKSGFGYLLVEQVRVAAAKHAWELRRKP